MRFLWYHNTGKIDCNHNAINLNPEYFIPILLAKLEEVNNPPSHPSLLYKGSNREGFKL